MAADEARRVATRTSDGSRSIDDTIALSAPDTSRVRLRTIEPNLDESIGTLNTDRTLSRNVSDVSSTRRPIVAALLGTVAAGLGHLYLRRWARAGAWAAIGYAAVALFVPETAVTAVVSGGAVDPLALGPVVVVAALSAVDAYRIALFDRRPPTDSTETADRVECPACGRPVDLELDFCHWCTTEFGDLRVVAPQGDDGSEDDQR